MALVPPLFSEYPILGGSGGGHNPLKLPSTLKECNGEEDSGRGPTAQRI